jgi:GNAT superfamily N-acetyltransferase
MISLHRALPQDEAAVFILARDMATSYQVDRDCFSRAYPQVLVSNDMCLTVAETSGVIIGYVLGTSHLAFYANGKVAWVEEIMVKPDFRRKGIGKLLMQNFEAWAASKECRLVALATRRASDFYQSLGYAESASYFRKTIKG